MVRYHHHTTVQKYKRPPATVIINRHHPIVDLGGGGGGSGGSGLQQRAGCARARVRGVRGVGGCGGGRLVDQQTIHTTGQAVKCCTVTFFFRASAGLHFTTAIQ